MLIRRKSMFSGIIREIDLPITPEEILNWEKGMLVQDAFPNLDPDQREFFMTGITSDEWDEMWVNEPAIGNELI